ncbi:MAG: hypothetical protein R3308_04850 [Thiohalobacterales bacterium]|nr:hypothetical protein [Thiohalobacterales bacterium]
MKISRLIAVPAALGLALVSQMAMAKGPSWTYAEIGYVHFDADKYDGNGAGINLSYDAMKNIFVKLGYSRLFIDATGVSSDIDADRFEIGMGGHMSLTDNIDAFGSASYVDIEYSGGIPTEADEGYLVELGVRGMVSKKVELNAKAAYQHLAYTNFLDISDDDDYGFEVGTVIKLKKKFHFTGNISYFDETEETGAFAGIRLNF